MDSILVVSQPLERFYVAGLGSRDAKPDASARGRPLTLVVRNPSPIPGAGPPLPTPPSPSLLAEVRTHFFGLFEKQIRKQLGATPPRA